MKSATYTEKSEVNHVTAIVEKLLEIPKEVYLSPEKASTNYWWT